MSLEDYVQAQRAGQKEYRACLAQGISPYLCVLDDVLSDAAIATRESLGLVDIPMESLVGTKTSGRHTTFSPSFLPLLSSETEFAGKWANLSDAHIHEGIRVPIKAYEYMNRFYVEEGNKRVSVLKYYGAVSIPGTVVRLVPRRDDTPENRSYYEFLDFYKLCGINYLQFSRPGSYAQLQSAVCKASGEVWSADDRRDFHSFYMLFRDQFLALGGGALSVTAGDAALVYLSFYRYSDAIDATPAQIRANLDKIWDEVKVLTQHHAVELSLDPQVQPTGQGFLSRLIPGLTGRSDAPLKIVFLHENNSETSAWTRAHGKGRMALKYAFGDRIEVEHRNDILPGIDDEVTIEDELDLGAQVIFTTSSQMMPACLKAAARHPDAKILNCSLNVPHPSVRTYAPRMYEAKFLLGMLAGILSPGGTVGYVANYPIYGVPASINAFAQGLRAVRPDARVCLRWLCDSTAALPEDFADRPDITVIAGRDQSIMTGIGQDPGLYRKLPGGGTQPLASSVWRWGHIYQEIVRSILDGTWNKEEAGTPRAINYWWGMSSGAVGIHYTSAVPVATMQLIRLAEQHIASGELVPFAGEFRDQSGMLVKSATDSFSARQLIHMDWLCDNVDGRIPPPDESTPSVRSLIELQGVAPKTAPKGDST